MIYQLSNELIRTPTEEYDFTNPEIPAKVLFDNLKETMKSLRGAGLTCNQVGLKYSVFVLGDYKSDANIIGCFNPKIVNFSEEKTTLDEGCLSFPGLVVPVERSVEIRIRYQDYLGSVNTTVFRGLTARIFQHEMDHINGVTFLDGLSKLKLGMLNKKAKKLESKLKMDKINNERYR